MEYNFYVYILANWNNKVLYIGVTNNLARRLCEHRYKKNEGFTEKYNVNKLVYYERFKDVYAAIRRGKQLKSWSRDKKNKLVYSRNPDWIDLFKRKMIN